LQANINFLEMLGGGKVPAVLVGTWLVMGILLVFGFLAGRALKRAGENVVPDEKIGVGSIAEIFVEWMDGFVNDVVQLHEYRGLVPFFGSLFVFILLANFLGLIPGMEPPTADSDLTFALGTISLFYFIFWGFRKNGFGYLKSFLGPLPLLAPLMLPIEVADNLFRPFSLGLRLFANMFADHQVLGIATELTKVGIPLLFYALGSIVCIIQAIIFVVLSMAYVRLAASHEH
jgi:F-type H+-transporting ATPase subunit a